MATSEDFVALLLAQEGDKYKFGVEVNLEDVDPEVFDCSELVQWATHQLGINFPDGSWAQIAACERAETVMSATKAAKIRGALLWREGHVAISLGDGRTIEAMGTDYGVVRGVAKGRFTKGGLIPFLDYPNLQAAPTPKAPRPDKPQFKRTIEAGSTGVDVLYVQKIMRQLGYFEKEPNAIYGTLLSKAIRRWQQSKGLKITGIITRKEWELL